MAPVQLPTNPISTVDPFQYLNIVRNPNGSLTRNFVLTTVAATPNPTSNTPAPAVLSRDVTINQSHNTWARIFLPRQALDNPSTQKLPILLYFHGGGFILFSVADSEMHNYCSVVATQIQALVISVEYRLAPEHRLPAAYEDAMDALQWIRTTQDEWVTRFGDLSNCFLMGLSAGGNIAYHAALRVADSPNSLEPLKIRGLILQQPFFGGVDRSGSEKRLLDHAFLPLSAADLMWELSLPVGADRDHHYCNILKVGAGEEISSLSCRLGLKVMVTGCDGDPLFDCQVAAAEMMADNGVQVVRFFGDGGYHGMDIVEPLRAAGFLETSQTMDVKMDQLVTIKKFITQMNI